MKKKKTIAVKKLKVTPKEDKKVHTFIWPIKEKVNEVCLAGDFNNWKPEPMAKLETGFLGTVKLGPGVYQYKFIVDGQWQVDPSAMENAKNDFGSSNSVVYVS